jgi:L-seryl-tRNA(Ser) seleniumtransferase
MKRDAEASLRELPSVNVLLERPRLARLAERYGRTLARESAQGALDELRALLRAGKGANGRDALLERAEALAASRARAARRSSLRRVVNATGVVLHTNLGRAPLARAATRAAARAGQGYVALEYDLAAGTRGSRYVHCERLLRELTGTEAALVVNNNAAALLLSLNTTAEGRAVLVSRGEMVEIGGGFRVHEILAKSGARLVEVGSTNKTHAGDYIRALRELPSEVGAVLKVHRSNFVQSGFVAEVELAELAEILRREADPVALVYDLGSGCLVDLAPFGLPGEPRIEDALAAGADLVTFSGDKLLGGPQAGILLGSRAWIERAKKNPLTRALRVDKLTLAALEATLQLYKNPDRLGRIPALALLGRSVEDLRAAAAVLLRELSTIEGLEGEVVDTEARAGGGSLPGAAIQGAGVALRFAGLGPQQLEARLRGSRTPVIGRVAGDRVILDLRSVPERDLPRLARLVRRAFAAAPNDPGGAAHDLS